MTKNRKMILLAAIIIIELAVLIFFGSLKKGMHFDECFSYFNTNNSFGREAFDRTWVTSENIKKDFYVLPGEGFNYGFVVKLQSYDVHPPVYYLLLHTVCSFTQNIFSMWQGIGLNIFISVIATVFLFFIADRFLKNDLLSAIAVLIIILNPGFISNVMFIRMYALMTLWMIIQVWLHIKMCDREFNEIPAGYFVLSALITYLGFLTHYFYLVFLFFLEAAFLIPHLKMIGKELKTVIRYCALVALAGILGVVSFPACLGHVNSGYRGVEVKGYMFDLSDIGMRIRFFGGLIGRFVLNGVGYIVLLFICLLLVTVYYKRSREKNGRSNVANVEAVRECAVGKDIGILIRCILIPVIGYFIISAKGSLIGDEAMMRYQLPIYPFIPIIVSIVINLCFTYLFKENTKAVFTVCTVLFSLLVVSDIVSDMRGNVYYLYPEQEEMLRIAKEQSSKDCVYIYNSEDNKYFLWNDAMQLWQYDSVYFIDFENRDILDEPVINASKDLVVYVSKLGEEDDLSVYSDFIKRSDKNVTSFKKLYETAYATAYEFY
ncbi:MAG: glycosyltransferase family 39 protein [Lachnospiraceae bacterium]|nr:glycosyltransferase family 39 protein [Lachnospiraceae bacterium]